jgi:hypothetical protein
MKPHVTRPLTPKEAPDTARVYERAKPEAEAGMGKLDKEKARPANSDDKMFEAVHNKHDSHQINAEDTINSSASAPLDSSRDSDPKEHSQAQRRRGAKK